ncbi:MAG: CIA30 family protein [Pseudomonadota bacterium]
MTGVPTADTRTTIGSRALARRSLLVGAAAAFALPRPGRAMTCTALNPKWAYVADTVMGGVSTGRIDPVSDAGRSAMRLTGRVSLDNNGGFIQMAFDPVPGGPAIDASAFTGIRFETRGNGETYDVSLRTTELKRPWQSYRASFTAGPDWTQVTLPFADFEPNRAPVPFDPAKLRRIGILAIGREFDADVAVAGMCLTA